MRSPALSAVIFSIAMLSVHCHGNKKVKTLNPKAGLIDSSANQPITTTPTTDPVTPESLNIFSGEVANLGRGTQFLTSRLWALQQAKQSVKIQAFIIKGDEASFVLTNKLVELAQRGIKIKIAIDPVANPDMASQLLYHRLKANGIEMAGDDPAILRGFDFIRGIVQTLNLQNIISSFSDFNFRDHQKIFLVDGDLPSQGIAIVGGTNIANEYFQTSAVFDPQFRWLDHDIMLRGQITTHINQIFDKNFSDIKLRKPAESGSDMGSLVSKLASVVKNQTVFEKLMRFDPSQLAYAQQQAVIQFVPVWHATTGIQFLQSNPRVNEKHILSAYLSQINNAKKSIKICNSYFIPVADIQEALILAARRGVKIEIISNHPLASDYPLVQEAGRGLYKNLLNPAPQNTTVSNIRIFEWGGHKVHQNGYGIHHGKYAVFDDVTSIVGSFNLDPRSIYYNSETVAVVHSPELAIKISADFASDHSPANATEVSYQTAISFTEDTELLKNLQKKLLVEFVPFL